MARPLSLDLRVRAVRVAEAGTHTRAEVAQQFGISERTLYDWLARKRAGGTLEPKPHGGGTPPLLDARGLETLRRLVREKPDRTLDELAHAYAHETGIQPSRSVVHRAVVRLGLVRKKRP